MILNLRLVRERERVNVTLQIFQSLSSSGRGVPWDAEDGRNVGRIFHITEGTELLALLHHVLHARLSGAQLKVDAKEGHYSNQL